MWIHLISKTSKVYAGNNRVCLQALFYFVDDLILKMIIFCFLIFVGTVWSYGPMSRPWDHSVDSAPRQPILEELDGRVACSAGDLCHRSLHWSSRCVFKSVCCWRQAAHSFQNFSATRLLSPSWSCISCGTLPSSIRKPYEQAGQQQDAGTGFQLFRKR